MEQVGKIYAVIAKAEKHIFAYLDPRRRTNPPMNPPSPRACACSCVCMRVAMMISTEQSKRIYLLFLARTLQKVAQSPPLVSAGIFRLYQRGLRSCLLIQSDNCEALLLCPHFHTIRPINFNLVEVASKDIPVDVVFTYLMFPNTANHHGKFDMLKCRMTSSKHIEK